MCSSDLPPAVLRDVEADLVAFAAATDVSLSALSGSAMGERVRARVRDADLVAIETMTTALSSRVRAKRVLPMPDEWVEMAGLRARAELAARHHGPDVRRYFAERLFNAATHWACLVYNEHKEHVLGNALFTWLNEAYADVQIGRAHV